jgi:hypothetical protein
MRKWEGKVWDLEALGTWYSWTLRQRSCWCYYLLATERVCDASLPCDPQTMAAATQEGMLLRSGNPTSVENWSDPWNMCKVKGTLVTSNQNCWKNWSASVEKGWGSMSKPVLRHHVICFDSRFNIILMYADRNSHQHMLRPFHQLSTDRTSEES